MKIISGLREMQDAAAGIRRSGKTIGVVPTMGFLHDGHGSLIGIARKESDVVITTIFVNPAQFGPNEDFEKYPRDMGRDTRLAESSGTDILFAPSTGDIYPAEYRTFVSVETLTDGLEGKIRPGHFRGVATIVAKLFNLTKPHLAVFGQKDAQQAVVIRRMASDLNFDLRVIVAPIVREKDGLAMSSRNVYLSPEERRESTVLHRSLKFAEERIGSGDRNSHALKQAMTELIRAQPHAVIDYVSFADPDNLEELKELTPGKSVLVSLAVRFGATRLLDNSIILV